MDPEQNPPSFTTTETPKVQASSPAEPGHYQIPSNRPIVLNPPPQFRIRAANSWEELSTLYKPLLVKEFIPPHELSSPRPQSLHRYENIQTPTSSPAQTPTTPSHTTASASITPQTSYSSTQPQAPHLPPYFPPDSPLFCYPSPNWPTQLNEASAAPPIRQIQGLPINPFGPISRPRPSHYLQPNLPLTPATARINFPGQVHNGHLLLEARHHKNTRSVQTQTTTRREPTDRIIRPRPNPNTLQLPTPNRRTRQTPIRKAAHGIVTLLTCKPHPPPSPPTRNRR